MSPSSAFEGREGGGTKWKEGKREGKERAKNQSASAVSLNSKGLER